MFKREIDSFLDQIRPYLKEYLEDQGIDTSKNFSCLCPDHEDSLPSMTCSQAETRGHSAWCFGCGRTVDIFDACSYLENKPTRGAEWMTQVVIPLAAKFGIKPPDLELTHEELYRQEFYRIYERVAGLLTHDTSCMAEAPAKYIEDHGWLSTTTESLDIGTVSYEELATAFGLEDLARFGLNKPDIFDPENLIFTFRDSHRHAVRFHARRFKNSGPKFTSTSSTGLLVDVWRGGGHLYLSHLIDRKNNKVVLVEGQPDAVSLWQAGIPNPVALCGATAFSDTHADVLAFNGTTDVTAVLDGDDAGRKGTERLVSQGFVKTSGVRYYVVILPEGQDPDSFIRSQGREGFETLLSTRLSTFGYLLSKEDPAGDCDEAAQRLVPYIASNPSEISRELMSRELSNFFGGKVSVGTIMADVRRADQAVLTAITEKKKAVIEAVKRQASQNVDQAHEIFRDAEQRLKSIEDEAGRGANSQLSFVSAIQNFKQWGERDRGGIPQEFELLPGRLDNIQKILSGGDWAASKILVVGAVENIGKSSLVNDLAWQIASNPANHARVFIQTLDDPREVVISRLVCQAYGEPELTINMVSNPVAAYESGVDDVFEMREEGYARLMEVASEGRIIVKDASEGKTVAAAETYIRQLRRQYPNDNIVYVLDNFHNVADYETLDMRTKFTKVSKDLVNLCSLYHCTIICTAEYRKGDQTKVGTNDDLAEARALKFDGKLILHLFSDSHVKGGAENAELAHVYNNKYYPRVMARVGKNKITNFKEDLAFDFFPASGLYRAANINQVLADIEERRAALGKIYLGGETRTT